MTSSNYSFYTLPEELSNRLEFDPIPFPVRGEKANSIFKSESVPLDALLDELDQFVKEYPEQAERFESNAAQLALICATNNVTNGDFLAALANLHIGLRIDPQHKGLQVHQALALQISGYTEAAAMEYERLLWDTPQAFDPIIRALAAKAFAAIGLRDKALDILEFLPERAFLDPSLNKLRESLLGSPVDTNIADEKQADRSKSTTKKFCTKCGNKLKPGIKFCTGCGTVI